MRPVDLRGTGIWPKQLPELTHEQLRARDAFMARWLEVLPRRYGMIQRFNQTYGLEPLASGRTLEIGAGLGEHLQYEDLANQDYYAVEIRDELANAIKVRYPK